MRVVVTGAAGFIGIHALRALVDAGHEPIAWVRSHVARRRFGGLDIRVEEVELGDAIAVQRALHLIGVDAILHLAWVTTPGEYMTDVSGNLTALRNSLSLLDMARRAGVTRVVLAGTCVEDGLQSTPYSAAKSLLHEAALGPLGSDVSVACLHIHSPYGPGENQARVLPAVITSLLARQPIALGHGRIRRDYIHVADVGTAAAAVVGAVVGGRVDVCTGRSWPLREVLDTVTSIIGGSELLLWGKRKMAHEYDFSAAGDPATLRAIGWQPSYDLGPGLRDTVTWWSERLERATLVV